MGIRWPCKKPWLSEKISDMLVKKAKAHKYINSWKTFSWPQQNMASTLWAMKQRTAWSMTICLWSLMCLSGSHRQPFNIHIMKPDGSPCSLMNQVLDRRKTNTLWMCGEPCTYWWLWALGKVPAFCMKSMSCLWMQSSGSIKSVYYLYCCMSQKPGPSYRQPWSG